ncbi:MAG: energy-coupling factor transporter transmembrane component T [Microthrixaceae bacterium]
MTCGPGIHPGAWWLWALGVSYAVSQTTNLLLLGLLAAGVCTVVLSCRGAAPWGRAFGGFAWLAAFIVGVRLAFHVLVGVRTGSHVVVRLPEWTPGAWAAGLRVGGVITLEGLAGALGEGGRLAVLVLCLGAANSLAGSRRLLKVVPGALYELGTAVVVALTLAPQLVAAVQRVRLARRLRGEAPHGFRGMRSVAVPVLTDALDASLHLAESMDARGYGRRVQRSTRSTLRSPRAATRGGAPTTTTAGGAPEASRRVHLAGNGVGIVSAVSLVGVALGLYGMAGASRTPTWATLVLGAGVLGSIGAVVLGPRSAATRYRPDPWRAPEWMLTTVGALAAVGLVAAVRRIPDVANPPASPLRWPDAPLWLVAWCGSVLLAIPVAGLADRRDRR